MVPLEPDSKLKMEAGRAGTPTKSPSDSDVRLEHGTPKRPSKLGGKKSSAENLLTEEIDLDAELKKAEEAEGQAAQAQARQRPATAHHLALRAVRVGHRSARREVQWPGGLQQRLRPHARQGGSLSARAGQ
jgi:hypothetical protein